MTHDQLTDDQRWDIALAKDRRFDGVFVTGVHSTGIYCRPSCPARAPLRTNVRFYAGPVDAEAAGLRACKRCAPDQQSREEAAVLAVLTLLRDAAGPHSLDKLGAATGYSPAHLQRLFTRAVGLSPAAYARALRRERADAALSGQGRVTDAIYEAGYSAPSRFYDERKDTGLSAGDWSKGGAGRRIEWAEVATTLGPMLVAATDRGVCCLAFGEGEADLRARFPNAELVAGGAAFRRLLDQVVAAVETPGTGDHIPLDVKGTAFQHRVWEELRRIPPGETLSYGQLAARVGNARASRAVGGANGANHVAVLIPCHRVIAGDGTLGGYAYGLAIKRELLDREGNGD
ncbi:methylated-DNA--[protein]-cysteine S-methyltransferase [Erythrobacter arachoides]|uniref:methylated-DNA--[protein]-cysteine S-methyltransferase n=1 Tax=Aurantiacibacter arachoides TaxID=1850444 RepID=A0A845A2Z3_9SPHN|nr:methylated-DNA--[protein]-cysteine S-methyltransferase [Aurantiacibacter arachoides]MXO93516.1 methylated-DNA--[protein]-cysteine S-methyltransferase [Aurantiacibacter arachoides]GGD48735.1 bifunctional transcriptional activator/DNA repair enzyme protein Ada [Aurantiacibacter arachoides]